MREHNIDLYSSLFALAICVIFASQLKDFGLMGSIFPKYVMIVLGICSGLLLIKSLIKPVKGVIFKHKEPKRMFLFVVMLLVWVWLLDIIGFVITSTLFYFLLVILLDKELKSKSFKAHLINFGIVLGQILFFYVVFEIILGVPLPHGFLL
jgi:hypothetical protein